METVPGRVRPFSSACFPHLYNGFLWSKEGVIKRDQVTQGLSLFHLSGTCCRPGTELDTVCPETQTP